MFSIAKNIGKPVGKGIHIGTKLNPPTPPTPPVKVVVVKFIKR